jgi:CRP/FNR family transcriptional regulator
MEDYIIKFLKTIDLFSPLTNKELSHILKKINSRKFKKNEIIIHIKDANRVMYIILHGKVKVIRTTDDGKEIVLAMHQTGDFFGEMSFIDGKTAPATVMATEDSHVLIISRENFYSILFNSEKVLQSLLQILTSRIRESWDVINLLNFKNASERIQTLFILLSNKYGQKMEKGLTLDIKLTHQDIANMSGVTRETVTRVLDKLQKDGDIAILENKFIHLSHNFLKKHTIV